MNNFKSIRNNYMIRLQLILEAKSAAKTPQYHKVYVGDKGITFPL